MAIASILGDTGESMDLGDVGDRIKRVPPIVWVGAGVVILFIFFMGKGSPEPKDTSGDATSVDSGATDSGEESIGQAVNDILALTRANTEAQSSWQQSIAALIAKMGTPTPNGGGSPMP